jgi:hypothetical protein
VPTRVQTRVQTVKSTIEQCSAGQEIRHTEKKKLFC